MRYAVACSVSHHAMVIDHQLTGPSASDAAIIAVANLPFVAGGTRPTVSRRRQPQTGPPYGCSPKATGAPSPFTAPS